MKFGARPGEMDMFQQGLRRTGTQRPNPCSLAIEVNLRCKEWGDGTFVWQRLVPSKSRERVS